MRLQDLESTTKAQTRKVFESQFGQTFDTDNLSPKSAHRMLKKVQGLINEHRTTPAFHRSERNAAYLKLIMIENALQAHMRESSLGATPSPATGMNPAAKPGTIQPAGATPSPATGMNPAAKPGAPVDPKEKQAALSGIKKLATATGQQNQVSMLNKAMDAAVQGKPLNPQQRQAMSTQLGGIQKAMSNPQTATKLQQMVKTATAESKNSRRLREASELQQAQVVLAAQDMVDQIQGMIEDISAMQFKDLPALVNSVRNDIGMDQAQKFNNDSTAALQGLIQNLQASKQQLESAQGILTGQAPVVPGADASAAAMPPADDLTAPPTGDTTELDLAAELDVDDEEQPPAQSLGRSRR
jgi:hypothetical protein